MKKQKIAINGLGRIGRCVLRALVEYAPNQFEIVAVNGPAPTPTHLHLLKYDSVHGRFAADLTADGDMLILNGTRIPVYHERDAHKLPWKDLGVDVVFECTGHFKTIADCGAHLDAGAKKVIISSPSPDAPTIVLGANEASLTKDMNVLSIGSCTTNALAPLAKILDEAVGIEHGFMTTIHSYTADQNLVDGTHSDLRRARAAALSMIPTSTGAAKTLNVVLPALAGKLDGVAIRVPTANVSMVDLTFTASKDTSKAEINALFAKHASKVLAYSDEPLVSIDFTHHSASSVFDASQTFVVKGRTVRVASWYDNEWGFSCRMVDVAGLL